MPAEALVEDVIRDLDQNPPNFLSLGTSSGESDFARRHVDRYIRTIYDVSRLLGPGTKSVLEIGAFTGVVSICLKKLGCDIEALDIPEYFCDPHVQEYFARNGIKTHGVNLRHGILPFESDQLDLVIMCETLEHLNFNPIPVLWEISRALKTGGYFYLSIPNLARLPNRVKLLLGRQIYNSVDDLFLQLHPRHNMIVGLHWHEYTMVETKQLLQRMGFSITRDYFYSARYATAGLLRTLLTAAVPSWRSTLIIVAKKEHTPQIEMWRTEANT
jgi:SAM-dependent methyltransferase